ncbi:PQQ-binding-like beta-propeller repeat protein [Carboxylicivirga sp. M1479]|uniref:outer membrane protein assembly factor BamB family protein n=1 Tax=Carboxylicivirga sp. M1479 TaxID=2594476 RepID=UPI001C8F2228|nr:PQQ-binding-like beta-propeller repeat protein [Carboxylicivirga sp. M1479]
MNKQRIIQTITIVTVLVYTSLIAAWQLMPANLDFAIQAPGADNRPAGKTRAANDVVIGEYFMRYDNETSALSGNWTKFRGPLHNNIIRTEDDIQIPSALYPEIWSVETGEGHASPVIFNGKVYFLDYDEKLSSDALRCFSLETGKELWRRWYRVPIKRNHGFSRTTPFIAENYIITIGPEGHVMCCDPSSGDMLWSLDMQKEYTTEVPFWYTGQCPLVDDGVLILAPAGKEVLMTGLDCLTGEILWTTPNSPAYKMSHSSVVPMSFDNHKTYVYVGIGGICGVSAGPEDTGCLLWHMNEWQPSVVAPSPVQISDNQFYMTAGYGSGGVLIELNNSGNKWSTEVLDKYKPNAGISSEQQTPIFHQGKLISVMPKDGGRLRGKLVSYSPSDLHTPLWTSAADEKFGLGPYLVINDYLFALKDDGELYVYQIESDGMTLVKKQRIMDGRDAWGPMAYADGMLIIRDAHIVKCLKII